MNEQIDKALNSASELMKKSLRHLGNELAKIHAGKASPLLVEDISVDYYGNPTPLNQVANISTPDSRTLTLQPWEKTMIQAIEKAILTANIGITPQNDGQIIRLFLPPLTEERRKELVKTVNAEGESAKIAIRSIRRDTIEQIKKLQKDGLSEDAAKNAEGGVQGLTDNTIESIDKECQQKEKEIMTI